MPNIIVYGTPVSTYIRTVRLLLAEANINDYELKNIAAFNLFKKNEQKVKRKENIKNETGSLNIEEEPLPLNDPFAGDASTASDIVTEATPTSSAVKLRSN